MKKYFVLMLTMLVSAALQAGELDDLLDKHYQALGGKDKIKNVKSLKMSGKLVMKSPQGNMEIPFTGAMKKDGDDNLFRFDATMQGMTMTQSISKDGAWQLMPMMGVSEPQDMNADEAKQLQKQADVNGPLWDYEKKGNKLELVGKEDVEGTEAYKIKVTTEEGDEMSVFLDSEYFLIIKTNAVVKQMGMEMETDSFPSDYKEVGGVLMAHSMTSKTQMGEMIMQFESMEANPDIPNTFFDKPAADKKE